MVVNDDDDDDQLLSFFGLSPQKVCCGESVTFSGRVRERVISFLFDTE